MCYDIFHLRMHLFMDQILSLLRHQPLPLPWNEENVLPGRLRYEAVLRGSSSQKDININHVSVLLLSAYRSYQIRWYLPLQSLPGYFPPFTVMSYWLASRIADSTEIGIASFSAQEKSTIRTDSVFRHISCEQIGQTGTSQRIRNQTCLPDALPFLPRMDLSFSDSSIMVTIFS